VHFGADGLFADHRVRNVRCANPANASIDLWRPSVKIRAVGLGDQSVGFGFLFGEGQHAIDAPDWDGVRAAFAE